MGKTTHQEKGFSLIELMFTIALLAILLGLGVPSLQSYLTRNTMRTLSNDFKLSMMRARTEAVSRGQCVTICMSSTIGGTNRCATTGTNWGTGWIVFENPTCAAVVSTSPNSANGQEIIFAQQGVASRYQLNAGNNRRSITFNARGASGVGGASSFNLVDSDASGTDTINQTLCVDMAGRVRSTEYGSTC